MYTPLYHMTIFTTVRSVHAADTVHNSRQPANSQTQKTPAAAADAHRTDTPPCRPALGVAPPTAAAVVLKGGAGTVEVLVVGLLKVGAVKVGVVEVGLLEVGAVEVGLLEVGVVEVGVVKVGVVEVGVVGFLLQV